MECKGVQSRCRGLNHRVGGKKTDGNCSSGGIAGRLVRIDHGELRASNGVAIGKDAGICNLAMVTDWKEGVGPISAFRLRQGCDCRLYPTAKE